MANSSLDQNYTRTLLVQSSTLSTTLLNLTATPISGVNPLNVAIMDASGVQITTFGASTVDGSTFTQNTTAGGISMGVYQSSPDTITTGKSAAIGIDVNRNTKVVGSIASASADSGNPVKVGGKYNASAPTFTDGNRGDLQLDINGNTQVNLNTLIAGENQTTNRLNVEPIYSYSNITSQTTTTVKSGAGTLHAIIFNTPVASSVITIYDNTAGSGTKIGTITLPATLLNEGAYTALYDISFSTGLTIVTGTASSDLTIAYR